MTLPTPGRVVSVNLSEKKTVRKTPGQSGTLVYDRGFEGDAHAGDWHRQVSLLAQESIDSMVAKGLDVGAGDFAENITTEGIDLPALPVGTVLKVGEDAVLEVSQIGKVCHTKCAIYYQAGDCVMPREGIFVVVREPGDVAVGDTVEVVSLGDGTCDRVE
ncbi:MAG: MOSC domain-containing protein [Coriobacteriia bacterium]|nr:MOSC domain-containing protein [Coriobacteriia bacterium]